MFSFLTKNFINLGCLVVCFVVVVVVVDVAE